jgi:alpha,alpha-trehalase
VAVHYRKVKEDSVLETVRETVGSLAAATGLRKRRGKEVLELEPDVEWNKGHALTWLLEVLEIRPESHLPLYIGDDETDEDAFAALAGRGPGVRVGAELSDSLADFRLENPGAVRRFLEDLHTSIPEARRR